MKLLYQNSWDGAISVWFAVMKFPNGTDSDVGIGNNLL